MRAPNLYLRRTQTPNGDDSKFFPPQEVGPIEYHIVPVIEWVLLAVKNGATAGSVELTLCEAGGYATYIRVRDYLAANEAKTIFARLAPGVQTLEAYGQPGLNQIDGLPIDARVRWLVPSGATVENAVMVLTMGRSLMNSRAGL